MRLWFLILVPRKPRGTSFFHWKWNEIQVLPLANPHSSLSLGQPARMSIFKARSRLSLYNPKARTRCLRRISRIRSTPVCLSSWLTLWSTRNHQLLTVKYFRWTAISHLFPQEKRMKFNPFCRPNFKEYWRTIQWGCCNFKNRGNVVRFQLTGGIPLFLIASRSSLSLTKPLPLNVEGGGGYSRGPRSCLLTFL
jgi:hypothetical protein